MITTFTVSRLGTPVIAQEYTSCGFVRGFARPVPGTDEARGAATTSRAGLSVLLRGETLGELLVVGAVLI